MCDMSVSNSNVMGVRALIKVSEKSRDDSKHHSITAALICKVDDADAIICI